MRRCWSGDHPASGQGDFPGVDQQEVMASPMDVMPLEHPLRMGEDFR